MKTFFRLISFLEGMSYILLLFIAVPIKYWGGDESLLIKDDYQWNRHDMLIVCLASIIPFGTFYMDRKYLR